MARRNHKPNNLSLGEVHQFLHERQVVVRWRFFRQKIEIFLKRCDMEQTLQQSTGIDCRPTFPIGWWHVRWRHIIYKRVQGPFWATVCKTVRPMLSDRCLSVLSVCLWRWCTVLWRNGWMDQDATWYEGRPRPRRHCLRWGPSPPKRQSTAPHFPAHVYCGQTAGWIKLLLRTEIGLGSGYIVLDGDPAPHSPAERGTAAPTFRPMSVVAKRSPISATAELL